jgi:hypothetical protein
MSQEQLAYRCRLTAPGQRQGEILVWEANAFPSKLVIRTGKNGGKLRSTEMPKSMCENEDPVAEARKRKMETLTSGAGYTLETEVTDAGADPMEDVFWSLRVGSDDYQALRDTVLEAAGFINQQLGATLKLDASGLAVKQGNTVLMRLPASFRDKSAGGIYKGEGIKALLLLKVAASMPQAVMFAGTDNATLDKSQVLERLAVDDDTREAAMMLNIIPRPVKLSQLAESSDWF